MLTSMMALLLTAPAQAAETAPAPEISVALATAKKPKWDPKGKALEPFLKGDIQDKKEEWEAAIPLYLEALKAQPGCGKCLDHLVRSLVDAKHYPEATKVSTLITELFPEQDDGWIRLYTAESSARHPAKAIAALDKVIEMKSDTGWVWWARTEEYINMGDTAGGLKVMEGAKDAGLADEDAACNRLLLLVAAQDAEGAHSEWEACSESKSLELKRSSEGWLALLDGDTELAAKRLMQAGAGEATRLSLAIIRHKNGDPEAALNLLIKLQKDLDWTAWDADLAQAQALEALGKSDEALKLLEEHLLAEGWVEAHKGASLDHVLLKAKGADWAKAQGHDAVVLAISMHIAAGHRDAATSLYEMATEVYGADDEALKAAISSTLEEAPAEE